MTFPRCSVALCLAFGLLFVGMPGCSSDDPSGPGSVTGVGPGSPGSIKGGNTTTVVDCEDDAGCPVETPICSFAKTCVQCMSGADCDTGTVCMNGCCVPEVCIPGQTTCCSNSKLTCKEDGQGWESFNCGEAFCSDGACTGCTPNETLCDGNLVLQCAADGSAYVPVVECPEGRICANGKCMECYPQDGQCNGFVAQKCNVDGFWEDSEDCAASGKNCFEGFCVSPCVTDPKFLSNSGCDYWAVDLDNHYDANAGPYAVIVSNLSDEATDVSISSKDSEQDNSQVLQEELVTPGQLKIFNLAPRNPGGSGIAYRAYRVQSSLPIVAYQFNPLDNVDVFSNDASLLLPISTFGTEYMVMSRMQFEGGGPEIPLGASCDEVCGQYPGYVCQFDANFNTVCTLPYRGTFTVVAAQADTQVTVVPTINTLAGDGVPAMSAGMEYQFVLQPYQVLNVLSDQDLGDLTGTVITSNKPVGVFSGHEASVSADECCADHLEQQLFPVKTWGTRYVAAKSFKRGIENDYWRVLAKEDNTTITFEPAVEPARVLNRGEWFELASTQDFVVDADKPITLAQTLASSNEIMDGDPFADCSLVPDCPAGYQCTSVGADWLTGQDNKFCFPPTCAGVGASCSISGHSCVYMDFAASGLPQLSNYYCAAAGDPAMILTPPVKQFRKDYVFLTPNKYSDDYVNVIAPATATVTLDGSPVSAGLFTAVGSTGYMVARMPVADGVHTMEATEPIGVVAYGYDKDVSYGYTAGLNLTTD